MSVLGTDTFTRANETPLAGNWTTVTSETAFNLASNAITPSNLNNDCGAYRNDITPPNDQYSQLVLTVTNTGGGGQGLGVACRIATGARTYYRVVADHASPSANVELGKMIAGAFTVIWSRSATFTNGDALRLEVQGTTLRVYIAGVQVGADATDSAIASGRFGISYSSVCTAATGDNWEGGDFGGAATSALEWQQPISQPTNHYRPDIIVT